MGDAVRKRKTDRYDVAQVLHQPPTPIYSIGHSTPVGYVRSDGSYYSTIPQPKVSVIVATYGYKEPEWIEGYDDAWFQGDDEDWLEDHPWEVLAKRAVKSVGTNRDDFEVEVVRTYGETLAKARNEGAARARGEWLIFLDADDQLAPGYVKEMLKAATYLKGDIFKPSTLGVYEKDGSEDQTPVLIPKRNLLTSNHIVIGAMVRKELFLKAGGFMELPALEDWDLWLRCVLMHDAKVVDVPTAVYKVWVKEKSRNNNVEAHRLAYKDIIAWSRPIARSRGISEL